MTKLGSKRSKLKKMLFHHDNMHKFINHWLHWIGQQTDVKEKIKLMKHIQTSFSSR